MIGAREIFEKVQSKHSKDERYLTNRMRIVKSLLRATMSSDLAVLESMDLLLQVVCVNARVEAEGLSGQESKPIEIPHKSLRATDDGARRSQSEIADGGRDGGRKDASPMRDRGPRDDGNCRTTTKNGVPHSSTWILGRRTGLMRSLDDRMFSCPLLAA